MLQTKTLLKQFSKQARVPDGLNVWKETLGSKLCDSALLKLLGN